MGLRRRPLTAIKGPTLIAACSAVSAFTRAPPSPSRVQPSTAVAPVIVVAREGRHRDCQAVADLVHPSVIAEDRRKTAVVVNPTVAAASSSSPSSSGPTILNNHTRLYKSISKPGMYHSKPGANQIITSYSIFYYAHHSWIIITPYKQGMDSPATPVGLSPPLLSLVLRNEPCYTKGTSPTNGRSSETTGSLNLKRKTRKNTNKNQMTSTIKVHMGRA
uniref:Uncharacterized protein n=1 Tax=Oryza sativa subsp. japonica TaxID=39947 RepID=Q6YW74_ORYSJ|nr:hypothetical protein [Oryza sativa Japonica Group]BAD05815.1 hypothetical protein [Oryza sativa Japonica Group]